MASTPKILTDRQTLKRIKKFVASFDNQRAAAEAMGISPSYLSDVLRGRRAPTDTVLAAVGLKVVAAYSECT